MTRTQINPAQARGELLVPSGQVSSLFRLCLRWYLRRHFNAVRVANAGRIPGQAKSLILFANHSSWWDPLTGMLLTRELLPDREHYAPIDTTALSRYGILHTMGFFGVENSTRNGTAQFLRTGSRILRRPGSALWLTPESDVQDVRKRPIVFEPHLGTLMSRSGRLTCVPVAVEYVYWDDQFPEILVNVGEPLEIADGELEEPRTWTNLLSYAMAASLDELAMLATGRDSDAFEVILSRSGSVDGKPGLWKRLACAVSGRPYDRDHRTLRDR